MIFSSHAFIFFLIVVVAVFVYLERQPLLARKVFLILASLFFYAWWRVDMVALLLGSIVVNFLIGEHLHRPDVKRRLWATVGVLFNLGLLGVFKYLGLFTAASNTVLGLNIPIPDLFLPLAISFFTFQQISYIVDSARGTAPDYTPIDYMLFICFFPHLIAGPIVRHNELIPQFSHIRTDADRADDLAVGLTLFTIGLFKKVVIANSAAPYSDAIFDAAAAGTPIDTLDAWFGAIFFSFQIYFDFSAYTDMALGMACLFGIRLPINFNSPYKAANIIDFWRRWHISLSSFLRDYLYIALGGGRKGDFRRYGNILMTMLIGGLWHGASWTFVVWGGLHGFYLCVNHLWRRFFDSAGGRPPARWGGIRHGATVLVTYLAVVIAWVFFRAADFTAAGRMLSSMAGLNDAPTMIADDLHPQIILVLLLGLVWFAPNSIEFLMRFRPALHMPTFRNDAWFQWRPSALMAVVFGIVFLVSLFAISNLSPFIYFQF